jgi:hypothetical protein
MLHLPGEAHMLRPQVHNPLTGVSKQGPERNRAPDHELLPIKYRHPDSAPYKWRNTHAWCNLGRSKGMSSRPSPPCYFPIQWRPSTMFSAIIKGRAHMTRGEDRAVLSAIWMMR